MLSGIRWEHFHHRPLWKVSTLKRDGWGGDAEPGPQAPIGAGLVPWAPSHVFHPWGHVGHSRKWEENERFCWKQQQPSVHPGWRAGVGRKWALNEAL